MNSICLTGQIIREPKMLGEGRKRRCVTRMVTESGERRAEQYHNLIAWRAEGDELFSKLTKGDWVCVVGKQENSRTGVDGKAIYWSQVLVDRVQCLGRHAGDAEVSEKDATLPPYEDLGDLPDDGWAPHGEDSRQ